MEEFGIHVLEIVDLGGKIRVQMYNYRYRESLIGTNAYVSKSTFSERLSTTT